MVDRYSIPEEFRHAMHTIRDYGICVAHDRCRALHNRDMCEQVVERYKRSKKKRYNEHNILHMITSRED